MATVVKMGTLAFVVCFLFPALTACFHLTGNPGADWFFPNPLFHEVWPDVLMPHGDFLPVNLIQTPSVGEPWSGFPMPVQAFNVGSGFVIKLMNCKYVQYIVFLFLFLCILVFLFQFHL